MSNVSVSREYRTYDFDSPHSFFRDQADAIGLADLPAQGRLLRHLVEVSHEVAAGTAEGRRALRERAEQLRTSGRDGLSSREAMHRAAGDNIGKAASHAERGEFRAATASTLSGFTTPQWIVSKFALFRATQRTFADQCTILPIPEVGLQINVPRFTAAASAGAQTEGSSISSIELDPTGFDEAETVQTIAGQIVVSQQLLDRSRNMPDGPQFDYVIYEQLRDEYDRSLNNYTLGKSISRGSQVAGATSITDNVLATLYADLATARERLTDTAGVRLQPTHLITTPDFYSFCSQALDAQKRPILVPTLAPGVPPGPVGDEEGDRLQRQWAQFTGTCAPGLLFWFIDATIQPTGSNTQIIVGRPDKILLFEGDDPVTRAFPETVANQLQVVVQYYNYAAVVPRFPGAIATITGNAYPTSLK